MNWKGFWIGQDQAFNCLIQVNGQYGQPDEMLSARAYRLRAERPRLQKIIDLLFFWDKDHCKECYEIEKAKAQLPEEYRN